MEQITLHMNAEMFFTLMLAGVAINWGWSLAKEFNEVVEQAVQIIRLLFKIHRTKREIKKLESDD